MNKVISILFALLGISTAVCAQTVIPNDPEVIKGHLDNGMTYYIRHNENPKGCADFYIAHNVGALQEEDNQNGLAHFLEHMAFNGTKHFPDQSLLNFLAKEGVRFGTNVNAYTSKSETVYNLSKIPLKRESFVDSVLLILHDWSCNISCEPEALDNERGVISEEWRRRDDTRSRMGNKQFNLIYKGSKLARRPVIGTLEVINGFKRHEIIDFYHKWYRPDLQAIVIVGDFDPKDMEAKVRAKFSDIPARVNPEPKGVYKTPSLSEPLFENVTDPQIKYFVFKAFHRQNAMPVEQRNTEEYFRDLYTRQIVSGILDERFSRDIKKEGSNVGAAVVVTNQQGPEFYVTQFTLTPKNEKVMTDAIAMYAREREAFLRFGFTEEEFNQSKFRLARKYHLNTEVFAADVTSEELVKSYIDNFLKGASYPFPVESRRIQKKIMDSITYESAKGYENKIIGAETEVIYCCNANDSKVDLIPPRETMEEIFAGAKSLELKPEYLDIEQASFNADPIEGKLTAAKKNPLKGTSKWDLADKGTVYITKVDKVDANRHFVLTADFNTGYKVFDPAKLGASRAVLGYLDRNIGFQGNERTAIADMPALEGVGFRASINRSKATFTLTTDEKSVENGLKLMYLTLTEPYFGKESTLERFKADNLRLLGREKKASDGFKEDYIETRYGGNPWMGSLDSSDIKAIDLALVADVFRSAFGKREGLKIYITTDLDEEVVLPLVRKYVASVPNSPSARKEEKEVSDLPQYRGKVVLERNYPVETVPKAEVDYSFKTTVKADPKTRVVSDILDYILSARYRVQIREVRGGTYTIAFRTQEFMEKKGLIEANINFNTRPEMLDVLLQDIEDIMAEMCAEGPTAEEMETAKLFLTKSHFEREAARKNDLGLINGRVRNFIDYGVVSDYDYNKVMNSITAKDVRNLARRIAKGDRMNVIYSEK